MFSNRPIASSTAKMAVFHVVTTERDTTGIAAPVGGRGPIVRIVPDNVLEVVPRRLTSTFGRNAKRGVLRLQSGDYVRAQFTHEFQKLRGFRFRSSFNVVILNMIAFHPTCVQVCGIRLSVGP